MLGFEIGKLKNGHGNKFNVEQYDYDHRLAVISLRDYDDFMADVDKIDEIISALENIKESLKGN